MRRSRPTASQVSQWRGAKKRRGITPRSQEASASRRMPNISASCARTRRPGLKIPTIHDGQPKAAGRHGVGRGGAMCVKGDLNAGHAARARELSHSLGRWMAVLQAVRPEQHDAVAGTRTLAKRHSPRAYRRTSAFNQSRP
jgi:hypothetical protein